MLTTLLVTALGGVVEENETLRVVIRRRRFPRRWQVTLYYIGGGRRPLRLVRCAAPDVGDAIEGCRRTLEALAMGGLPLPGGPQ